MSATPTSTTVSVTKSYAGTTAADAANGATVDIIGYAVTDGADPAQFTTTDNVNKFNYHQVFQEAITVSDLNEWAAQYGIKDKFSYQVTFSAWR